MADPHSPERGLEAPEAPVPARRSERASAGPCSACCDLPWRRPRVGACRCGGRHETEPQVRAEGRLVSYHGLVIGSDEDEFPVVGTLDERLILATGRWRSVDAIRRLARVDHATARKRLDELVEAGQLAVRTNRGNVPLVKQYRLRPAGRRLPLDFVGTPEDDPDLPYCT